MSHKQIGIQKGNCNTWETQNIIVASRMLSLKNVVMLEHNTVVPEVSGPPPSPTISSTLCPLQTPNQVLSFPLQIFLFTWAQYSDIRG